MPPEADCVALIMAGGRSARMRVTAGPLHKALVPVGGIPLIERNTRSLLSEGFQQIVVAVSIHEPAIGEFVEARCSTLASHHGATVRVLWETTALGTIGAAREAIGSAETLLVVNVDNLTSLPLRKFLSFHRERNAALTVAAHEEPFQIPFGELALDGDRVREYLEKPNKPVWISSGTYVLSRTACCFIPADRTTDVPQLVGSLIAAGQRVVAFRHDSDWIDVNHAEAIQKAERLVARTKLDGSESNSYV